MERPAKLPWWQATKTPRQAYVLGSIWLVLGLGQLVLQIVDDEPWSWYPVAFIGGFVLLGLGYLASGLTQARRSRRQRGE